MSSPFLPSLISIIDPNSSSSSTTDPTSTAQTSSTSTSTSSTSTSTSSSPSSTSTSSTSTSTTSSTTARTTSSSTSSLSSSSPSTAQPTSTSSSSSSAPSSSSTAVAATSSSSASTGPTGASSTTNAPSTTPSQSKTNAPSSTSLLTTSYQTTSDGQTIVVTTVVPATATANSDSTTSSKPFFQQKGAVAGVFTVVGLVVAVIVIVIITIAIRRRRAKKFDQDAAEAAAEAANAHVPDFADDDYGYPDDRERGYSDTGSHGTFNQPPMQPGESYNMSELPPFDPYAVAGAAGDPYAAGAAGIGAAGVNRMGSLGHANPAAPYNAFTQPVSMQNPYYDAPAPNGAYPAQPQGPSANQAAGGPGNIDLLHAAGLGAAAGLARGPSQHVPTDHPPDAGLSRNKSLGANTLGGMSSASEYSSSTGNYQTGYGAYPAGALVAQGQPGARPLSTGDPYSGYSAPADNTANHMSTNPLPNPFEPSQHVDDSRLLAANFSSPDSSTENGYEEDEQVEPDGWQGQGDSRMSLRDSQDYGYGGGRRVLKVANE